jgi:hypothetical protein
MRPDQTQEHIQAVMMGPMAGAINAGHIRILE